MGSQRVSFLGLAFTLRRTSGRSRVQERVDPALGLSEVDGPADEVTIFFDEDLAFDGQADEVAAVGEVAQLAHVPSPSCLAQRPALIPW